MHNDANHNEISNSMIEDCGRLGEGNDVSSYKYHHGEGIYLGTSPSDTSQPMAADDATSYDVITGNHIETFGSECVDIKENAHDNVVSSNLCAFDDEPATFDGSNLEIRGYNNTVSNNLVSASRGYGLKLGTDTPAYNGHGNVIIANSFSSDASVAVLNKVSGSQGQTCANGFAGSPYLQGYALPGLKSPCPSASPTRAPSPAPSPSPVPTTTPSPSPSPVTIPAGPGSQQTSAATGDIGFEAESGARTGSMARIARADAEAGWYLIQSTKGAATATYTFSVTKPGLYTFAARVIAPTTSSDSIYYRFDSGVTNKWGFSQHLTAWSWFAARGTVSLSAGSHTLVVTGREPNTMLDAFRLQPAS